MVSMLCTVLHISLIQQYMIMLLHERIMVLCNMTKKLYYFCKNIILTKPEGGGYNYKEQRGNIYIIEKTAVCMNFRYFL